MVYKTVKLHTVLASILREIRITDSSFLEDIEQWLQEAIKLMKIKNTTSEYFQDVEVCEHVAELPCGLTSLSAVEYEGNRLREGSYSAVSAKSIPTKFTSEDSSSSPSLYQTDTSEEKCYPDSYVRERRGQDLKHVGNVGGSTIHFYKLNLGVIHTSFSQGVIRLHYRALPTDSDGCLLVPDNQEYKIALKWYVYARLSFSGYKLPNNSINFSYCESMFEKYSRKAKNKMRYMSEDRKEAVLQATRRLITPEHFYEDFRVNSEQVQRVNTHFDQDNYNFNR
jgi:hypothetical protein